MEGPANNAVKGSLIYRWHNHLNPTVKKEALTPEEEKLLFNAHFKYGNKWAEIAKLIPGRTDNTIKNHFYSTIRRELRKIKVGHSNDTTKEEISIKALI